ncbi:class I SAM-dependent RNA methyltransferase [Lujinxingia litoralis]|nr:methyltransferase [Lujinxingia litoralis]
MSQTLQGVEIAGLNEAFEGYVERGERRVLAGGAVPGDRVDLRIVASSQHHPRDFAEVASVHARGADYVEPICAHAGPVRGRCGGCPGMHLSHDLRTETLQRRVAQLAERLGCEWSWHEAPAHLGYRNRSNFVVTRQGALVVLGSYAPRSQEISAMAGCQVVQPAIARVHGELEALLSALKVPVGEEEEGLRWVSLRASAQAVVVELVVRDALASWLDAAVVAIAAVEGVQGVAITVNARDTNAIRVQDSQVVQGKGRIWERYGEVELGIDPGAFAQLNVAVASAMYRQVARWAEGAQVVWDLYCGIGGLGLNVAARRPEVRLFGAESVPAAIASARENAARAGIKARYAVVDLGKEGWREGCPGEGPQARPELIVVNPPRKGLSRAVRQVLGAPQALGASTLIYMSCDVSSFGRDAAELQERGWVLRELQAHDMLPQTTHVELLGRFERSS